MKEEKEIPNHDYNISAPEQNIYSREYFIQKGAKGGKAGTGSKKRRSPEHYKMMAQKSAEARKKK